MKYFSKCKIISTYKNVDGAICQPIISPRLTDFKKLFDDPSLCIEDLNNVDQSINYEVKYELEQQNHVRMKKINFV